MDAGESDLLGTLEEALGDVLDAPAWRLAFSGGLDSSVLLHLLSRLGTGPSLRALHINHGMQREADEWAAHCQRVCAELEVPLDIERVEVEASGDGPEAAARRARYASFERAIGDGEVLLLAHHLDDQVETFLLRLMRGAGPRGLAGMPATRALGPGRLLRPLLGLPRSALLTYARDRQLSWIEDPSNADTALARNYLRRRVLPQLEARWPAYRRTVARSMTLLAQANDALVGVTPVLETVYSVMEDPGIALAPLLALDDAAAGHALRAWLEAENLAIPDSRKLKECLRQLRAAEAGGSVRLDIGRDSLQVYRGAFYRLPPGEAPSRDLRLSPGQTYSLEGVGELSLRSAPGPGLILGPQEDLTVSFRSGGERCRPLGRGASQSLKKLLQEAGVPPWWRDRLPLVRLGDELLAVGDLWMCESSRVRADNAGDERRWQLYWRRPSVSAV
ncbi:MAG: tRNA lysidine(34) synthetase TilS [Pseudomonadota bacterium]